MQAALEASRQVRTFREAAAAWGLGYDVRANANLRLAAYDGPLTLQHARPVEG